MGELGKLEEVKGDLGFKMLLNMVAEREFNHRELLGRPILGVSRLRRRRLSGEGRRPREFFRNWLPCCREVSLPSLREYPLRDLLSHQQRDLGILGLAGEDHFSRDRLEKLLGLEEWGVRHKGREREGGRECRGMDRRPGKGPPRMKEEQGGCRGSSWNR